jgi:hypothetical protein
MSLPTARSYAGTETSVLATCHNCDRTVTLDLYRLISEGFSDIPLIHLKLKCKDCSCRKVSILITTSGKKAIYNYGKY